VGNGLARGQRELTRTFLRYSTASGSGGQILDRVSEDHEYDAVRKTHQLRSPRVKALVGGEHSLRQRAIHLADSRGDTAQPGEVPWQTLGPSSRPPTPLGDERTRTKNTANRTRPASRKASLDKHSERQDETTSAARTNANTNGALPRFTTLRTLLASTGASTGNSTVCVTSFEPRPDRQRLHSTRMRRLRESRTGTFE